MFCDDYEKYGEFLPVQLAQITETVSSAHFCICVTSAANAAIAILILHLEIPDNFDIHKSILQIINAKK